MFDELIRRWEDTSKLIFKNILQLPSAPSLTHRSDPVSPTPTVTIFHEVGLERRGGGSLASGNPFTCIVRSVAEPRARQSPIEIIYGARARTVNARRLPRARHYVTVLYCCNWIFRRYYLKVVKRSFEFQYRVVKLLYDFNNFILFQRKFNHWSMNTAVNYDDDYWHRSAWHTPTSAKFIRWNQHGVSSRK